LTLDNIDATVGMSDMHDEDFFLDGIKHPYMMAYIFSFLNPEAGLLIAAANTTPEGMLTDSDKESNIVTFPKLNHWSDVAFLQWQSLSIDGVMSDLKFVARVSITNEYTTAVLSTVLVSLCKQHNAGEKALPRWPGVIFTMNSEEGMALLGTPNGSGVAWLLAQHKKELGHKCVEKVRLWYSLTGPPNLLFHLRMWRSRRMGKVLLSLHSGLLSTVEQAV
jgi:hypothetical protein